MDVLCYYLFIFKIIHNYFKKANNKKKYNWNKTKTYIQKLLYVFSELRRLGAFMCAGIHPSSSDKDSK